MLKWWYRFSHTHMSMWDIFPNVHADVFVYNLYFVQAVEKSSRIMDHNFSSLKVESERLKEHSRRACKCWIWIMISVVIIIFICKFLTVINTKYFFVKQLYLRSHRVSIWYLYFTNIYPQSQLIICISFILSVHYRFRPLWAILRWTTTTSFIYLWKPLYHSISVILQLFTYMVYICYYLFIYFTIIQW
jgi:hypothetical protein